MIGPDYLRAALSEYDACDLYDQRDKLEDQLFTLSPGQFDERRRLEDDRIRLIGRILYRTRFATGELPNEVIETMLGPSFPLFDSVPPLETIDRGIWMLDLIREGYVQEEASDLPTTPVLTVVTRSNE
jgi:hypothetical protein